MSSLLLASGSLSGVNIQWIRNVCNEEGIEFPNADEYLSPEQMAQELTQVKNTLYGDILNKYIIL